MGTAGKGRRGNVVGTVGKGRRGNVVGTVGKGRRGNVVGTVGKEGRRNVMGTNLKQNEAQSARAESTHKGVNQRSQYVTQVLQQRPELPVLFCVTSAN